MPEDTLRITLHQYGAKPHSAGYSDNKHRTKPFHVRDDDVEPLTYRQIVENGKPVPSNQQTRLAADLVPKLHGRPMFSNKLRKGRAST